MRGDDGIVIVPRSPGPLRTPAEAGRPRDGLDDLIDELLPDTAEGPGLVDAGLLVGGLAVLGWSAIGDPPALATVAGFVSVGLGGVLPLRAAWRRMTARRRGRGTPLVASHAAVSRLVTAYQAVAGRASAPDSARAAAHGAMLEVASLLDGRSPASDRELGYVEARAAAVEALVAALDELDASAEVGQDLVVEAREELDALGRVSTLSRLDEVTAEVRARARRH